MTSAAVELIGTLLQGACRSEGDAEAVLAAAYELGVDPIDFCIHRCRLDAAEVYRRAAHWAGLAFSDVIPNTGGAQTGIQQLDGLARARSLRAMLFDREVLYLAPLFDEVLRLREQVRRHPEIARRTCVTLPAAIRSRLAEIAAPQLLAAARGRLAGRWPQASASFDLPLWARLLLLAMLLVVAVTSLVVPAGALMLVPLLGAVLAAAALAKLAATLTHREPRSAPPPLSDAELPVYSILIPLRDEAQMAPLLKRAMSALDYPPEKLDIKFVVEARSTETVAAIQGLLDDPRFELLTVPDAAPATKPKALDYALPFVRGSHVVVYDAEDVPNADQLRLAAAAFAADPAVDCLQAELLVDNARENLLTGLFTGEYAGQFGIMLPAMARWGVPMPLGGTSNHFRVGALRETGGWDAYNVTEDADLGVRLSRLRYRVGVLPSQTFEEAPIGLGGWLRQRRRWMKGWMQTFIVHNRNPAQLWRDLGWRNFLVFEIHVGAMIVSPILHTAFVLALLLGGLRGALPLGGPFVAWAVLVLVLGYGSSFAITIKGLERLGQRRLMALQLLLPFYWVLHGVATIQAAYELTTRPHFWAKTTHGLTRFERNAGLGLELRPAGNAPGRQLLWRQ